MFDLNYIQTLKLQGPSWVTLVDTLHDALKAVENTADIVKAIRANSDTLNALGAALALDNGVVEIEGVYRGATLLADEDLNDGDIVVMGRLPQNRTLLTCFPWTPDWVPSPYGEFDFEIVSAEDPDDIDD